jgi:hypothetical protein
VMKFSMLTLKQLITFIQLVYYIDDAHRKTPLEIPFMCLVNKDICCVFKTCQKDMVRKVMFIS